MRTLLIAAAAALASAAVSDYSQARAEQLWHLASAAYCDAAGVENWSCGECKASPIQLTSVKWMTTSSGSSIGR